MNPREHNTRLDVELKGADHQTGLISFFHCEAEGPFDILLPMNNDPFALVINLGPASDSYFLNGLEFTLPLGHFNIFYVAGDSFRWRFKEGLNNFLVIRVSHRMLNSLCDENCLTSFMEHSGTTQSLKLNDSPLPITPVIERDLYDLLSTSPGGGPLRAYRMQATSASLLIDAVEVSQLYFQKLLTIEATNEVRRICNYLLDHIEKVQTEDALIELSTMTAEEFKRVFELMFHWPVSYFIIRERLRAAETLIRFSIASNNRIAKKVGYQTESEFIRSFEERYGMGPDEFRQRYGLSLGW